MWETGEIDNNFVFCHLFFSQEEVSAEALKHLKLDDKDVQDSTKVREFPDFTKMITCITRKASERESKQQTTTVGNNVLPFPPTAFAMVSSKCAVSD